MDHVTALHNSERRPAGRQANSILRPALPTNQSSHSQSQSCEAKNVGSGERIASALAGTALVLGGISRGGLSGLLMGLGGGALVKRG